MQDVLTKCINLELSQHQQQQNDETLATTNNYNKDEWLVVEMAVLLYMGKLNDAFLLWRRTVPNNSATTGENDSNNNNIMSNERPEGLKKLWRVGSAMFQYESNAAFKEIHDILNNQTNTIPQPLNQTIMLQIEEAYRERIIQTLSKVYHKIHVNVATEKLGFNANQECLMYLQNVGWSVTGADSMYLSPPARVNNTDKKADTLNGASTQQNIAMLSDIVTFLERKRVNA